MKTCHFGGKNFGWMEFESRVVQLGRMKAFETVRALLWLKVCDWNGEVVLWCNCTITCLLVLHLKKTVTQRRKQTGRNVADENHGKGVEIGLHPKDCKIPYLLA
jgi:hypothetical protein